MTHVTCRLTAKNWDQLRNPTLGNRVLATFLIILLCSRRRVGALSDTAIRPSFDRLSVPWRSCPRSAAALGYRHAGCLQLSRVRTAYPSADGRRSAASRTAIGGEAYRLAAPGAITCCLNALVSVGTGIEALKIGTTYYKNILVS